MKGSFSQMRNTLEIGYVVSRVFSKNRIKHVQLRGSEAENEGQHISHSHCISPGSKQYIILQANLVHVCATVDINHIVEAVLDLSVTRDSDQCLQLCLACLPLQVEEQKRRAEADKLAAITALEARSREFMLEKEAKARLEARISSMQSQLLIGGAPLEDTPVFRHAPAM